MRKPTSEPPRTPSRPSAFGTWRGAAYALRALRRPHDHAPRLARAVRGAVARWRASHETPPADRLARLEDDLREVRTRVNALFFAVIAVGLSDLIGRLLA